MTVHRPTNQLGHFTLFIILLAFVHSFLQRPAPAVAYELLIGTGPTGSFSHFTGRTLCRILKTAGGELSCSPVPSSESTDNLTNLHSGSLDLALVDSKTLSDAVNESGRFAYIKIDYTGLRLITPLYREPILLLARQDAHIRNFNDLQNKRFNAGTRLSLEDQIFTQLLAQKGWQASKLALVQHLPKSSSQDLIALNDGSVQAMLTIGVHPNSDVARILSTSPMTLVSPMDAVSQKLIDSQAGFSKTLVSADTYGDLNWDLETLALEIMLIGSADLDDEAVGSLLEAIFRARKLMHAAHPALLRQRVTFEYLNNSYLHPHPAAILFFQANRSATDF